MTTTDFYWLAETVDLPTAYYPRQIKDGPTQDPLAARRFETKERCEQFIKNLGGWYRILRAVEHGFWRD